MFCIHKILLCKTLYYNIYYYSSYKIGMLAVRSYIVNFKLCKGSLVIFCTIFIALLAGCPIPVVDDITPPPPPPTKTAPGVMLAPTLEAGNGQLTAAWAAPEYTGSSAITEYHLRHSADGASKWTLIDFGIGLNTRHIIRGLTNGATYFVQVRAENSDGAGEWSPLSERITPATVPSKMSAPDLRVGNSQLTATWTAPDNGGNAIIRYEVQYRPSSPQGQWTISPSVDSDATDTSHTIEELTNGIEYYVQVRAVNSVTEDAGNGPGVGAWSTSTTATPINVPLVPTGLVLAVGNGQLTASWTAPSGTVDSYALQYHAVTAAIPAGSWTDSTVKTISGITSTSYVITPLTNGTEYAVQVYAVNAQGEGNPSEPAVAIPATVPAAPAIPTLTVGNSRLIAAWTAPTNNGGSTVTGYELQYRRGSGAWTQITTGISGTSHPITGLDNGDSYSVQVRAQNAQGWGAWSGSATATPAAVPEAPDAPTITQGNTQLTVSWSAPSDTGGSAVVEYHLRHRESGGSNWTVIDSGIGLSTSHIIRQLTNGNTYFVQVRAKNAQGEGTWSDSTSATPATVPGAPAKPTLAVDDTQLTASWSAPTNNGGSAVTGYDLQYRKGNSGAWTSITTGISGTSHPITGLDNGDSYSVQVRAKNAQGRGAWSGSATATPATVPGAPAKPTLTAGNGELEVSWTAPNDDGGSAITEYHLQYSDDGVDWLLIDSDISGTSHTITGLTNGTTYYVRVRAVNAVDPGLWSLAAEAIPVTVPKTMSAPTLTVGNARLTVRWTALTAPADTGGSAITAYHLRYRKGGVWSYITSGIGTNTNRIIYGLTNGSSYSVQVRAKNAVGEGGWSGSVIATPSTTPSTPNAPTLVPGNGRLTVSWTAPNNGGSPITAYHLSYRRVGTTPWTYITSGIGTNTSHTITGLTNGQEYEVDVRAKNARGESNWSQVAKATPSTVPLKPADPTVTPGDRRLTVNWSAPNDGGSAITGYDLQYRRGSGAWTPINSGISGTSHIITGLINGSGYSVQVRARNVRGNGAWSDSATATPAATPAKPNTPTVKVGNGKLKVSWTAPSNGGSAIRGYDMRYWSHGFQGYTYISTGPTTTSSTITGLVNGRSYSAQVRARNAIGWSAFSNLVVSQPLSILRNTVNIRDNSTIPLAGARAVTTAVVGGTTYLFVAGYDDDGVTVYRVNSGGTVTRVTYEVDDGADYGSGDTVELGGASGLTTAVIGGTTYLFVAGRTDDGFSAYQVLSSGNLVHKGRVTHDGRGGTKELDGAIDIKTFVLGSTTYVVVAGVDDDGFSTFRVSRAGNGNLTFTEISGDGRRTDGGGLHLDGAHAITTVWVRSNLYMYIAGYNDDGISGFKAVNNNGDWWNSDAGLPGRNYSDSSTWELDGAADLTTAVVGNTTYLYVAGAVDDGISVFDIHTAIGGYLTNRFNINDGSQGSKLDTANGLTTAKIGGTTYLFVTAKDDDSVNVFTANSNGSLTLVDLVSDNSTLELNGAYGATTAVVNGVTYLFVPGEEDNGFSVFAVDPTGVW